MREGGDLSKGDLSWHAGEEGRRGPSRSPVQLLFRCSALSERGGTGRLSRVVWWSCGTRAAPNFWS